ncbi:MAG: CdaR family protein [Trueperaceae bacterium]
MRRIVRARIAARRLLRGWPIKVGAIAAALLLWWVAATDPGQTTQRSLLVPLVVEGVAEDEVAVGVPARIEVVVTGPSGRMDRLRADDIDVVLDLSDAGGEFARRVEARVPTALRVERVVPAEVIGRLEAVRSGRFPVAAYLRDAGDARPVTGVALDPATVTVHARDPVLAQVAAVMAPVESAGATGAAAQATVIAVDGSGRPVGEVRIVPERVQVTVARGAPAAESTARVETVAISDGGTIEAIAPEQVRLVGPPAALATVSTATGVVAVPTEALRPGRYDLPVRLVLPDGVASRDPVVATVLVHEPDPAPGGTP